MACKGKDDCGAADLPTLAEGPFDPENSDDESGCPPRRRVLDAGEPRNVWTRRGVRCGDYCAREERKPAPSSSFAGKRRCASALRKAISSAIIIFCLQQRGSSRCRLALVWGVERVESSLAYPSRLRKKLCRCRLRDPKYIGNSVLVAGGRPDLQERKQLLC